MLMAGVKAVVSADAARATSSANKKERRAMVIDVRQSRNSDASSDLDLENLRKFRPFKFQMPKSSN